MPARLTVTAGSGRLVRGISALIVLFGLLAGVPLVLLAAGGNPLPTHIASLSRLAHIVTSTDTGGALFLRLALLVAWAGWAAFVLSVFLELIARLRGRQVRRLPGLAMPRRAAAGLFTAIAIMVGSGGMAASAFAAAPPPAPPAVVSVVGSSAAHGDAVSIGNPVFLDSGTTASSTLIYHVKAGDTLGGIAERFLGHFHDYSRIMQANPGLITGGPDDIHPGWTLHLPSDARDHGVRAHATGTLGSTLATQNGRIESGTLTSGTAAGTAVTSTAVTIGDPIPAPPLTPIGTSTTGTPVTVIGGSATQNSSAASKVTGTAAVAFGAVTPLTPAQAAAPITHDPGASSALILTALGLTTGVLGAHLLVRSRRRRATVRPGRHESPDPIALIEPPETPLSVEMNRLDLALRDLASLLGDRGRRAMPDIMGSWMADGNVHLMLTEPCDDPPAPWIAHDMVWTLPAHVPTHSYFAGTTPPLPALVSVGGGDDRRVLLDLERLGVVTIGGDERGATDLLRHVGAELTHGIWSDDVTIGIAGFDEDDTRRLTALGGGRVRAGASIADALDDAGRWINEAHERLAGLGVRDVLSGRVSATPAEARRLSPYALLIAGPDADDMERLERVDAYLEGRGRGQLAIAASRRSGTRWSDTPKSIGGTNMGRWPLTVDADHTVTMAFLQTRIPAVALDGEELASLADAPAGPDRTATASVPIDIPIGRHRAGRRQPVS